MVSRQITQVGKIDWILFPLALGIFLWALYWTFEYKF